jgi:ribosomal protein S18 acetylase RimI-like enzyme
MASIMSITCQKLLPVHAKAYRAIRLESLELHPESYGSSYAEQVSLPELRLERAVKDQLPDQFVVGAFVADTLVGICGFVAANPFSLSATGNLIQMYVREVFRGRGVGLELTEDLLAHAFRLPDIAHVVLEVNPQNGSAIRLYKRAGFMAFAGHNPSPTPGILMVAHKKQGG